MMDTNSLRREFAIKNAAHTAEHQCRLADFYNGNAQRIIAAAALDAAAEWDKRN